MLELLVGRPRTLYVNSTTGSDSFSGRSPAARLATLDRAFALVAPGGRIVLARGSVFRPSSSAAVPWSNVTIEEDGPTNLAKPSIRGSSAVSSASWTAVSGTEYKLACALVPESTPAYVFWDSTAGAGTTVASLPLGTAGSLANPGYQLTGGFLSVNIGREPTIDDIFEVPLHSPIAIDGKTGVTLRNIDVRYSLLQGITIGSTVSSLGVGLFGLEVSWCCNYGIHTGRSSTMIASGIYVHDSLGGITNHESTRSIVDLCTIRRCAPGVVMSDTATVTLSHTAFDAAYAQIVSDGVGGATQTIYGCSFVNQHAATVASGFQFGVTTGTPGLVNLWNCSFARGTGGTTDGRGISQSVAFPFDVRNCSLWGAFVISLCDATALNGAGPETVGSLQRTTSNIAVGGSGINRFRWNAGTGDILLAGDPYTSVATGDLSPKVASALLAAGIAIPGFTTGTPPDIGISGAA